MPGEIYIPLQVLRDIQEHVKAAVEHAESGYSSGQEEEDTITGELGGALRTKKARTVNVTEGQAPGIWRWSITYSKFRSKAANATESIIGADGILEIRVGNPERDQRKSALFQAKNTRRRDPKLVEQCAKMSVWREASFVISYSAIGYSAYSIDDIILSRGSIAQAHNGTPLATWIVDSFIGCRIGHPDLYYDKNERRLYWVRQPTLDRVYRSDRWVWVDFSPKHLIHIDVTPPNWEWSQAEEIDPKLIYMNRLAFTPNDLFGLEVPFTLAQLKASQRELLKVYHSDKTRHLARGLDPLFDERTIEIRQAFSELSASIAVEKKPSNTKKVGKEKPSASLEERRTPTVDEFFGKSKVAEKVKVRQRKKSPRQG